MTTAEKLNMNPVERLKYLNTALDAIFKQESMDWIYTVAII